MYYCITNINNLTMNKLLTYREFIQFLQKKENENKK